MDYATFLRQAERGEAPALNLLHGADGQLLDDALATATRGFFPDPALAAWGREVFDGRERGVDEIVRSAMTLPFGGGRRLVAVRRAQALTARGADALAAYAKSPNPASCLLLLSDEPLRASRDRRTDHWLLAALPAAAIVELPARGARELTSWLRQRAAVEGLTVSDEAARLLVELTGEDTAALLGEARKAALAGGPDNRAVGVKDVGAVVGDHRPDARGRAPRPRGRSEDARPAPSHRRLESPALRPDARREDGVDGGRVATPRPRRRRDRSRPAPAARGDRDDHRGRRRLGRTARVEAASVLGRRVPAQEQRRAVGGDGGAGCRPVRGEVTVRAIFLGVVLAVASVADIATAAERCVDCVTAGAASGPLTIPPGTPLAGYGNPKRRLLFPDVLGQHPHAFWFAPSAGAQDSLAARALVLESGTTRVAWVTLDLIAIDRAFT